MEDESKACVSSRENLIIPWNCAKTTSGCMLYHFNATNSSYCFYLSDLSRVYRETLNEQQIEARSQELNPNLEIATKRLFELVESSTSYECVSGAKILVDEGLDTIKIETKTTFVGFPFLWSFETKKEDDLTTRINLVYPLLGMSAFLLAQNDSLIKIIEKKDKELEDLKNQGVKSSRKYLETQKFHEESLKLENNLPKINIDSAVKNLFGDENVKYVYQHVVNELQTKSKEDETSSLKIVETKPELKHAEASVSGDKEIDQSILEMQRREELQKRLANQDKGNKKKKKIKF